MAKVALPGPMDENTQDNMSLIKDKAMVFKHGQADADMKGSGYLTNNMDKGCKPPQMERRSKVSGLKEDSSNSEVKFLRQIFKFMIL